MAQLQAPAKHEGPEKAVSIPLSLPTDEAVASSSSLPSSASTVVDETDVPVSTADTKSVDQVEDIYLVKYGGPTDGGNPQNWGTVRKWAITLLTSFGSFITMMSGSIIAPALPALSADLDITGAYAELILSIFVLAFAFGPLILAPFTEIYGRRRVWILCGAFYSIWNVVAGFANNKGTLIAARLLSGIGGSISFVIAWPVVCDIWPASERGKSFAISGFLPQLGPALGPLIGGVIAQHIGWRWIFWWAAITNSVLVIVAIFVFPETSAAKILGDKAKKLRKETGLPYHTEYEESEIKLSTKLRTSIVRPTRLLVTQPILQLISIFWAYAFGILYFFLSTFASLFTNAYGQTVLQSGLHYIAVAVGYILADILGGVAMDRLYRQLKKKSPDTETTAPEYRVPLMIPSGILIPIGLLWYGWSAHARVHWIMVDVGATIFACGIMLNTNALGAYLLDTYSKYTASAMAAVQVLRMTMGFVFPIFAPSMYNRLGYGWANTVLACIAFVFGLPAPLILWKYGARIRALREPHK